MMEPFLLGRLRLSLIVPHQLPLWSARTRGRTLAAIRHIFWCQISSTHSCRRGGGRSGGGGGGGGGTRQRGGGGVEVDESKQGRAWSWHVAFLKVLFSGRVSWCCQQDSSSSAYYHHHYYSTPTSSPLLTVVDYPIILRGRVMLADCNDWLF